MAQSLLRAQRLVVTGRGYSHAITSPGDGGAAMTPVLKRLAERAAPVIRVGVAGTLGLEHGLAIAADGIAEHLLPILEIMPLQRLAWRLALDRGTDPDRPRALAKVTETY